MSNKNKSCFTPSSFLHHSTLSDFPFGTSSRHSYSSEISKLLPHRTSESQRLLRAHTIFYFTQFVCKDADIAAVLISASPDAEVVVAAQPQEDLAYQVLGDPNVLEIVTAPDPSLAARNAFESTSLLAAPPIFKAVLALRQQKASYVFGCSSDSNVRLCLAGVASEEVEMTLYYAEPGVHVRFFTNRTYVNNRPTEVGTRILSEITQIQIQSFMFYLMPVCSFTFGPHIDSSISSETSSAEQRPTSLNEVREGPRIGRGAQGSVYLYRSKKSRPLRAAKVVEAGDARDEKRARREFLIAPRVDHVSLPRTFLLHD